MPECTGRRGGHKTAKLHYKEREGYPKVSGRTQEMQAFNHPMCGAGGLHADANVCQVLQESRGPCGPLPPGPTQGERNTQRGSKSV